MQWHQDKVQNPDTNEEVVKSVHKAAIANTTATHVPVWANGDTLPAGLQAKLTINQPGDIYEQEADRVAEQAMHMADGTSPVMRKDISVMSKAKRGEQATHEAPPIVNQALSSAGQPLDAGTQEMMEVRFGQDFGHVRVHADEQAKDSAQAIHARAYTVGSEVVFGEGQYQPGTSEGQRMLAHELTHVVQQGMADHQATGMVQRYEAPEHIDIGETGAMMKVKLTNGLELTYGEISALVGDFYKTPEMLDNADKNEVLRILQLIKEQRQEGGKIASRDVEFQRVTQEREKSVYDKVTGEKKPGKQGQYRGGKLAGTEAELETESYFTLAKKNELHFAPENLRSGWQLGHEKALTLAYKSFQAQKQGKNADADELRREALLTDAGYAHYLEDAFASGHILNPEDVKKWMSTQWEKNLDFKERAVKRLKEAAYKDMIWPNSEIDKNIDALLRVVTIDDVSSAGLKLLHDYLNQNGIDVINKRGDTWRAFGDSNLWKSQDSLKFAGQAVALSKQQVLDVLAGKSVTPTDVLKIPPEKVKFAGQADPVPIGTEATKKLLVVLESLLLDSDKLWQLLKIGRETRKKVLTPFEVSEIEEATAAERKQRTEKYGRIASNLIKARTAVLRGLNVRGLASDLLNQPYEVIEAVLDHIASDKSQESLALAREVANQYVKQIPQDPVETQLLKKDIHLLLRLQSELLSLEHTSDQRVQAYRIGKVLKRVPEGAQATAPGEFTTHQMEIAVATVTGDAKRAVEESSALKPEHILDVKQVAAASLIEKWGKIAARLKGQPAKVIIEVIDQLQNSNTDDDVSLEYMKSIPASPGEPDLRKEDPMVLRRLRQALRSGHVTKDEETQARRIDSVLGAL